MHDMDRISLRRMSDIVRRHMPSCNWDMFAEKIVADRSARDAPLRKPEAEIDRTLFTELDGFRRSGVLRLPLSVAPAQMAVLRRELEALPVYSGYHVANANRFQRPLAEVRAASQTAGYTMDQLLRLPGLVDLWNHPLIIDFVELYLGCVPTLYSVNAWWSYPAAAPQGDGSQFFHRDLDDWRFCTLFLYATDTDATTGAHQFIPGSHTVPGMEHLLAQSREQGQDTRGFDVLDSFVHHFGKEFSERCERLFGEQIVSVAGPAGSMFLGNTLVLHRGLLPVAAPRLMIWARYGLGPNSNSVDDEQGPLSRFQVSNTIADTPRNRYINRLLFQ
jgi:hypothetical protein